MKEIFDIDSNFFKKIHTIYVAIVKKFAMRVFGYCH